LCRHLYTCTHSKPKLVIGIQPVKLASPEVTQPSIVVIVPVCVGDDSGHSIENTLQFVARLLWCTDQDTATVVDPAGDKRLDESSGRVVVERAMDAAQLWKLKETFGTDHGDVLVKGKSGISRTPRTWTASDPTTWASPSVKE